MVDINKKEATKYKKHRKNRRITKTATKSEAEQAELRDGPAKKTVDEGPAIYPLFKKAIDPGLSLEKKFDAIYGAFSTPPDNESEDEESKQKQQLNREQLNREQLNREQFKSRQAQKNPPQGMGNTAGRGGSPAPKLAGSNTGAESRMAGGSGRQTARGGQGPDEEEEQRRGQKLRQGTKQLRGEAQLRMKTELKKKLKAEAKAKLKKAIKKKIIQRVLIWLAAAISPEAGIAVIIFIVLLYILIHVCDIPLISVALFVVGFITGEDVGGICELAGG